MAKEEVIGYMWLDDSPKKSLENKIKESHQFFLKKYGNIFDRCLINYKCEEDIVLEDLPVVKSKIVLNNHFYFIIKKELGTTYTHPNIEKEN